MKYLKTALAAAALAVAGAAQAGPTDLGMGPGTYTFTGNHDSAWYVTLGPGTYTLSSIVSSSGFDLNNVWFSTSKDHNCCGVDDIAQFQEFAPWAWSQTIPTFTLSQSTDIYVDIDTDLGKLTNGSFNGAFVIAAAPPVPEPATPMLMLAGLGLFGFLGRRRFH